MQGERPDPNPGTPPIRIRPKGLLRNRAVMAAAAGLVLVAAILIARSSILPGGPAPVAPPLARDTATPVAPRAPAPTQVLAPPMTLTVKTQAVAASQHDLLGEAPQPLRPALTLEPPFTVLDSTLIVSGKTRVRLGLVTGLKRDDLCTDAAGLRFACGLRGRAALIGAIGGRKLTCWPLFGPPASGEEETVSRCFAAGEDLGERQVEEGFARPASGEGGFYASAEETARSKAAGAWDGGWQVAQPGPASAGTSSPPAPASPAPAPAPPVLRP